MNVVRKSPREQPQATVCAVLFDMDGVITDTAVEHTFAWKRMFDEVLRDEALRSGRPFRPFDIDAEYRRHVDGKPRLAGVCAVFQARGIAVPEGRPDDTPDRTTLHGLAARKNRYFLERIKADGVRVLPGVRDALAKLHDGGVRLALFSASRNAETVLAHADLLDWFDARVDGADARRLNLKGKPDPAMLLEAAARLGVNPARTAVVEDSLAGIQAAKAGGFARTIGVGSGGHADRLRAAGADTVLPDLRRLADILSTRGGGAHDGQSDTT